MLCLSGYYSLGLPACKYRRGEAFFDKRAGAYRNSSQLQDSNKRAAIGWMQHWPESFARKLVINGLPSN